MASARCTTRTCSWLLSGLSAASRPHPCAQARWRRGPRGRRGAACAGGRRHGLRSVPVELGSGRAWREAVLTLRELVEGHLAPSARGAPGVETAYLAQHALLDQACFPRQAGDGVGASVCMCPPEYQKKHACNGQPTRSIDALLRVHEGEALQNGSS